MCLPVRSGATRLPEAPYFIHHRLSVCERKTGGSDGEREAELPQRDGGAKWEFTRCCNVSLVDPEIEGGFTHCGCVTRSP